ncbi:hypothetical protein NDU88_005621 [Pleurodeles waltl]|uniref:Uncharacterized protein n=1 Tax=Pleurodeles waltl TaxID=8319 RepID=A0AAV7QFE5_PLEWA|nr:hypothetical protein NDU88_005621 [Pleurodeles waltl]
MILENQVAECVRRTIARISYGPDDETKITYQGGSTALPAQMNPGRYRKQKEKTLGWEYSLARSDESRKIPETEGKNAGLLPPTAPEASVYVHSTNTNNIRHTYTCKRNMLAATRRNMPDEHT